VQEWVQVAADVFVRRYLPVDTTICVVRGRDGLLLVDTGGSPAEAAQIASDLRELGAPLRWVVNTHAHFDHTFGNQWFAPTVPIHGHHLLPAHLDEHEGPRLARWRSGTGREPAREWHDVVITPPTELVRERSWLDLGGLSVELVPLAPGHTDGDLVVRVPGSDARSTWVVGDVLEEPGPPMYGSGCYPMRWPTTLDELLDEVEDDDLVVPGHGRPVSRAFARAQQAVVQGTADRIRYHHAAGRTVAEALAPGTDWACAAEALALAVERGYAEIEEPPPGGR
jgi:glyoxylase-like metal-dependent hydrolase (beta-lactamase superfamily II)